MATKILPVIMCGGAGTRVWPESRETYPKQFIALIGARSTFQETVARVSGPMFEAPIVITNHDYRFLVKEQLDEIGASATIVTEPVRRDSGPAVAVAATLAAQRGPETRRRRVRRRPRRDQARRVPRGLRQGGAGGRARLYRHARRQADGAGDRLRLHPSRPRRWTTALSASRRSSRSRTARPPSATSPSGYLWNSGNFFFRADTMLEELQAFEPEMASAAAATVAAAKTDLDFLALDAASFGASPKKSIDYAVMERTQRAAVVPAEIGWSDVGNWDAVWKLSERDADGNSFHGEDGLAFDSKNVHVRADGVLTALVGVKDVIVVTTQDAVLVLGRDQGDRVKELVEALKARKRREATEHKRMYRPWGYYQSIDHGAALSGQAHRRDAGPPAFACRSTFTAPSTGSSSRARRR